MDDIGKYKYEEISNKVLRTDRRLQDEGSNDRRDVDTTPHSLRGVISVKDFGSNISTNINGDSNTEEQQELKKTIQLSLDALDNEDKNAKKQAKQAKQSRKSARSTASTLLDSANLESYNYTPTTESNLFTYNQIVEWCDDILDNDLPEEVIKSLADITIEILKSDDTNTHNKKNALEGSIRRRIDDSNFQKVYNLVSSINDYNQAADKYNENNDGYDDGLGIQIDSDDDDDNNSNSDDSENGDDSDDDVRDKEDDEQALRSQLFDQPIDDDADDIVDLSNKENLNSRFDVKSQDIDTYWLIKQLSKYQHQIDQFKHAEIANEIMESMSQLVEKKIDLRTFEHNLLGIQDFEINDFYYTIIQNYRLIFYTLKLREAGDDGENSAERKLYKEKLELLEASNKRKERVSSSTEPSNKRRKNVDTNTINTSLSVKYPRNLDLHNLVFTQGSKLMTVSQFQLPKGSFKRTKKSWEEIHIPAPEKAKILEDEVPVSISELPEWAQAAFPSSEMSTLNRIQSKVYPTAFKADENILMCAPTGAGKTNVAMLTILRIMSNFRNNSGKFQLNNFKIVYIAPLKALVQEQVREFERRLSQFGITVNELTGDSNLTKHQIESTQILVTTPEKWDVITRKNNDASYINLVRLVIIDEIHLLHDERGPVLENIVSRTMKNMDDNSEYKVRFVGLSATLPNYKDVAHFLRVDEKGLFYFDASYRPCPLAQQFVGITEKKAFKKYEAMNEVCYEKIIENMRDGNQVIIFVHSRKETAKTAKWLADKLVEDDMLESSMKFSVGVREILSSEAEKVTNKSLKSVLTSGFGIHHAGMNRDDRQTSEDLFAEGHIKVLVSTATLAWGVNLPAHTVIIKGTSVYSPEKGTWVDLSPQDILQMLGRAGRPRYDTHGDGIIITSQDQIKYYLAILNQQLPIESQMYAKLADSINAEIVSGSIRSLKECVDWIGYTYLYVRMLHSRDVYFVGPQYDNDPRLVERRKDLAYSAFLLLAKSGMIKYNYEKDIVVPTALGKIASYYYISYVNMKNFDEQLKPHFSEIELFRVFAGSEEFKFVPVRREEKAELKKLIEKAPIPINEDVEDPLSKINVLLQAYISGLKLDGFALMADMIYISQSAGRLFRALYDLSLRKGWAKLARVLLNISKMIEKKLWLTSTPLRQFPHVPMDIINVAERSMTPWKYYLALTESTLIVKSLKAEKYGNFASELVKKFPQLEVDYSVKPITPSLVHIALDITPHWKWDVNVHGFTESFTVLVEDCNGEQLLHQDQLFVRKELINKIHYLDFSVPIFESEQPNYFVTIISDRWLFCESRTPIMLTKLQVPKKFPALTPLIESDLVPVSEIGIKEFVSAFSFNYFNKFQSQAFDAVYNGSGNVMFATSKGNGKTELATLSFLKLWKDEGGRAIYIQPNQKRLDALFKHWRKSLSKLAGGKVISKLTGDPTIDLQILAQSHLVMCTPEQLETISRRWQQRKSLKTIELIVADDCHTIGSGQVGTTYETVLSRFRYITTNLETSTRVVALASSIASYKDFADWLDIPKNNIFDFDTRERMFPLELRFHSMEITHNPSLLKCLITPSYKHIDSMDARKGDETCLVFIDRRKDVVDVSKEFLRKLKADNQTWLQADIEAIKPYLEKLQDASLRSTLKSGIGYLTSFMATSDTNIVMSLFEAKILKCIIATKDSCYWAPSASNVLLLGTKEYDGREHRYIDYTINEILEMVGLARKDANSIAHAHIYTNSSKVDYYKRFAALSMPLESHLNNSIHDAVVGDIKVIKNRQYAVDWITYSLFYRRLQLNPSFYGLKGTTDNDLSEYLSELIENTLNDLKASGMIELIIDDDLADGADEDKAAEEIDEEEKVEIVPLNTCMIANHYNISYTTMELIGKVNEKLRLKKILEVVCHASEFGNIPLRENEDQMLFKLYHSLPLKWTMDLDFESSALKAFILLQAHFSRVSLSPELVEDLHFILPKTLAILSAIVDFLSSQGHLNAMFAMDLTQMTVQGVWNNDNVLKQIPFFDESVLERCKEHGVKSVYDIMELEDEDREKILEGLSEKEVSSVADFVNKYPNLEVDYSLEGSVIAGEPCQIEINISRDEDVDDLTVVSAIYPGKVFEHWWIVIGNNVTNELYAIKKQAITKEQQTVKMEFTVPEAGKKDIYIWTVCDSYLEADKQIVIEGLEVKAA
jgi:pre-mRNA-splicing helicase BRR2